ncbi:MAG: peptidyl-prolyl cis-trans isomerase [Pseudomonadota bacterium]
MKAQKILVKIVTGILFGLLILSFAIWGIGDIFREGGHGQAVATVGDVEIPSHRFSRTLNAEISRMSQQFGTALTPEQAQAFGIVQQVLERMVGQALFEQQAQNFGMTVTEEQIQQSILAEPAFNDQFGDFSRDRFYQVLRTVGLSEQEFIDSLSTDIEREQISRAVIDGIQSPSSLAEAIYRYQGEKRVADYVILSHDNVGDLPAPGEEDLKAFYEENGDSFMTEETRDITLVQLRPDNLLDQIAVSDEDAVAEFEARKDEFSTPERRTIEQLVFSDEADAQAAAEKLAGGADFATVSEEMTGAAPVSLGTLTQRELLPAIGGPAFALAANSPSDPVNSPLGWHILLVTDIQAGTEASFEDNKEQLVRDLALSLAVDDIISVANDFDDELAGGASLDDAANSLNIPVKSLTGITSTGTDEQGFPVDNLPPLANFVGVLEDTPLGESSLLTETDDGGYFILRVDQIHDAEQRPFEEVREQAETLWRGVERARLTSEKAEAFLEQLVQGKAFAELAEAEGLTLETSNPLSRNEANPQRTPSHALAGQLFDLTEIGAVTVASTDGGEVLAQLKEIVPADLAAEKTQLDQTRENLTLALQADYLEQYMAALRSEFGVQVNQSAIDRVLNPYAHSY